MKISLITATYNSATTIADCIASVEAQTHSDVEHIIIDGASKDNTLEIIRSMPNRVVKIVSEPDRGIYDAMNKGIKLATGEVVGILNSDDFYEKKDILEHIANQFRNSTIKAVYGDMRYVRPNDLNKTARYYSSRIWSPKMFRFGFMPGHPTFFTYKSYFDQYGYYKTDYKISADFELLVRFLLKNKVPAHYLNTDVVKMRLGGVSSGGLKSNLLLNKEIIRACKENGIYTNGLILMLKYFYKITEFVFTKNK